MQENKREFFRVKLDKPICANLTIIEHKGKNVKMPYTKICINDISAGGFAFTSRLNFKLPNDSIFEVRFPMFGQKLILHCKIVRKSVVSENIYKYGMAFISGSNKDTIAGMMSKLAILVRKNKYNEANSTFCSKESFPCDIAEQNQSKESHKLNLEEEYTNIINSIKNVSSEAMIDRLNKLYSPITEENLEKLKQVAENILSNHKSNKKH